MTRSVGRFATDIVPIAYPLSRIWADAWARDAGGLVFAEGEKPVVAVMRRAQGKRYAPTSCSVVGPAVSGP